MSIKQTHKLKESLPGITRMQGFSLLEALIGFMVLSVGLLGIASLQAVSLKAGKTSVYASVAVMRVAELIESMRANPTALSTYASSGTDNSCSGIKNCTVTELAQDDVYWWEQNLKAGLPGTVTTSVTVTAPTAPSKLAQVSVTVNWKERNKDSDGGSVDKSYAANTSICTGLPC